LNGSVTIGHVLSSFAEICGRRRVGFGVREGDLQARQNTKRYSKRTARSRDSVLELEISPFPPVPSERYSTIVYL
jgi:hypothetical protein